MRSTTAAGSPRRYWELAALAVALVAVVATLCSGGERRDDPTDDGRVTAAVRRATHDRSSAMKAWELGVLFLGYAAPAYALDRYARALARTA